MKNKILLSVSLVLALLAAPFANAATPYGQQAIRFTSVPIAASGSPADLQTVAVGLSRYVVTAVYAETISAVGTLAAGTIDIRTATAGGGASVLNAATALTGLTAADKAQSIAVADSANAGVVSIVVVVIPLPES